MPQTALGSIDREDNTFTDLGVSQKVQSRTIIFLKDNGERVTVIVMNSAKLKIGDVGTVTVKGNLLVEFNTNN